MRPLSLYVTTALSGILLTFIGCGGDNATDPALDPMQLIENVETRLTRHHPTKYSELDIGEFYVSLPIEGSIEIYRVTFNLCVIVAKTDSNRVEKLLEEHQAIIRDQVIATTQRIKEEKLHDPDLIWLKTELVAVLRSELKTTAIRDVVFSTMTLERG